MDADLLREIRLDVRRWPGGRSIRESYEPDVFEPTTLAVMADNWLAGRPGVAELMAAAETDRWTQADAERVLDALTEALADEVARVSEIAAGPAIDATEIIRAHARKAHVARLANERAAGTLPPLQKLVLEAEEVYGRDAAPSVVAGHLQARGHTNATTSNVGKARRALRRKGL